MGTLTMIQRQHEDSGATELKLLHLNQTTISILSTNETASTSITPDSNDEPPTSSLVELPWLISSPYTSANHLLNLSSLTLQSALLAQALVNLFPATPSYAIATYVEAFNWSTVFQHLRLLSAAQNHTWTRAEFYVVEFRSKLKPNIDNPLLFKLDKESHREATASGGLLKYWFGTPDAERRNLATCLWHAKSDAVAGGRGPWHKQARAVIPQMYESINVSGLRLTIEDDVQGWQFEPWVSAA